MKTRFHTLGMLASSLCMALLLSGCSASSENAGNETVTETPTAGQDAHAALHKPKYNSVLVEFPGHQFAMEIVDAHETTGLVTAYLTDAHFEPVEVDSQEVRLHFLVGGEPKIYTLTRTEQEPNTVSPSVATFTVTNMELASLNCDGWEGEATATVEISGTPYTAKLARLASDDHAGHDHAH